MMDPQWLFLEDLRSSAPPGSVPAAGCVSSMAALSKALLKVDPNPLTPNMTPTTLDNQ